LQRRRWLALARAEAEAAITADEDHIASAFRIVVATIEADRLPDPPYHGRDVLKGRREIRDRALRLAELKIPYRDIALATIQHAASSCSRRGTGAPPRPGDWRRPSAPS
jgi:hypothetical protein